ncbi:MAG: DNA polymerase [Sphaerochaetaceae bacterium]|nr:DNA polymerase [Sphaerochaetaceae bacterium]
MKNYTNQIKTLSIDIETFSSTALYKSGVYRYCESKDFEILLFAYSVNGGSVQVVDLAQGEKIPLEIIAAIKDEEVVKWAFNAMFERICVSKYIGYPTGEYLSPNSWRCTMIWSAYLGLPLSLEGAGVVLGLDKQKLKEGKELIRYFCIPCKPTKKNDGRTRNYPSGDTEKWDNFVKYNIRDVEVELGIKDRLSKFPVPSFVWDEYHVDQLINDTGVLLDMDLVKNAIEIDANSKTEITNKMINITELENPNSVVQMKRWLNENGLKVESLGKKEVKALIEKAPAHLQEILELRLQLSKSSIKKYQAMKNTVCADNRARGMFQFYGANRTGRFSGRNIQLQNLVRNKLEDLQEARELVKDNNTDALKLLYEDIPDTLSQLIRTAFIAGKNKRFIVADYSAIEARVIAWFANEKWRLDVFKNGGDIYCASASKMFKVPVEKHGINGHLRQKGKQAELACGYGGSVGALKAMGAIELGIKEEELKPIVTAWRAANPNIVKFWWSVDKAAKRAVKEKTLVSTYGIKFFYQSGILFIKLPSNRTLSYIKPRIGTNQFGGECITYEGIDSTKSWSRINTYGPKIVENIVQATSRDLLCYAMKNLSKYKICMHIHDEVVIEASKEITVKEIIEKMTITPTWAKGLLLDADAYETEFYKKD